MSRVRLRPATSQDEQFLWEMLYLASHSYEEEGVGPDDMKGNSDLVGYISGWRGSGLPGVVAEIDGKSVGAAWLRRLRPEDRSVPVFVDDGTPELAIAVSPEHQGNGMGSALLVRLIEEAQGSVPAIVLSARADSPAVGLYERHGFRVVDRITNRVGSSSVKMVLVFDDGAADPGG